MSKLFFGNCPRFLLSLCVMISSVWMGGCSLSFDAPADKVTSKKSLASLYLAPVRLDHNPLPEQGLQQIRDAYAQLLKMPLDDATGKIVQYRLADLEIVLAEQQHEFAVPISAGYYDSAIRQFQRILAQHPQQRDNADVLYQLAKAYDLQGQSQQSLDTINQLLSAFPDSGYVAEVNFRKGEILFGRNQYLQAIDAYRQVLIQGSQTEYFMTAAYMLGWSHFKTENYHQALIAFTALLDHKLPNSIIDEQMLRQVTSEQQLQQLAVGERRLVDDSIRIMALLFSYQGAEQRLQAFYQEVGERHYEYLLYDKLGQQFLNEDRYRDSASVYRTFTEVHPAHSEAPFFAVKQIDAYILGDFPTLMLPAKQDFVSRYGIYGPYWSGWGRLLQEKVQPFLHTYLQELAQYQHSRAQLLLSKNGQDAPLHGEQIQQGQNSPVLEAFTLAAKRYREFIATFPYDDKTPQMLFNLAESLSQSQQYEMAIEAYEQYAYEYLNEPQGAEAGYAAILSYRALRSQLADKQKLAKWRDAQLLSQQRFVARFATDPRALDVLYNTMQQQFEIERFGDAIDSAYQVIDWQPVVAQDKGIAANLVIAHSQFALQQYDQAEKSYEAILLMLPQSDSRHDEMRERLAASIYQQAEQHLAKHYVPLAIDDLLRIIEKTPQSKIRLIAQYDAATYMLQMQQWQEAAALLEDFRQRFSDHELVDGLEDKLIHAYQQSQHWLKAADELVGVWKTQRKTERGRAALYVASQYYLKAENRQRALQSYRSYAHAYPQPFAEAIEARYQMSQFYLTSDEAAKRRFWLKKIIEAHATAHSARTERSRYLAAMAAMVFADDAVRAFNAVQLTLPLKTALQKKRSAMEVAMQRLNDTAAYKVAEFSSAANYKIAQIYAQLAKDLMGSVRPKGLSALELEQYDILLEEQAFPFEEQAIQVHEANIQGLRNGIYDQWIKGSFMALSRLLPGRYDKQERKQESVDEIY